jgi:adenylate cyclase 10
VTTGLTYCGVVGHIARCEYTVIGRKVNMAARLMCNYPDVISCDQETYYNSRLNSRLFQILPDKILKVCLILDDNHRRTKCVNTRTNDVDD